MYYSLLFSLLHLASISMYSYLQDERYLVIAAAMLVWSLFNFIKVGALVLSPQFEISLDLNEDIPLSYKYLLICASALSAYAIWSIGYSFFAGFSAVYIITVFVSLTIQLFDIDMTTTDEDEE